MFRIVYLGRVFYGCADSFCSSPFCSLFACDRVTMELYNKGTFSEDILPVVIIGKSQHYVFVVFKLSVVKWVQ